MLTTRRRLACVSSLLARSPRCTHPHAASARSAVVGRCPRRCARAAVVALPRSTAPAGARPPVVSRSTWPISRRYRRTVSTRCRPRRRTTRSWPRRRRRRRQQALDVLVVEHDLASARRALGVSSSSTSATESSRSIPSCGQDAVDGLRRVRAWAHHAAARGRHPRRAVGPYV